MLLVYPQRNGTSAPPAAQLSESALNLNTPARQNASKLAFVFGLFVLWLRRRNGAFRLSGPFAGPSAIRVWNRSFFFHCRVFQILRLGKNASELAFFLLAYSYLCIMESVSDKIYDTLKRYWGFTEFRPVQERIIRSVMEGHDTLALMKDQVDRLRARRIPAVAIHSGLSPRAIDIALDNCVYGDVKFLYVAPERLATEAFRLRVVRMNVSLLAVDEAHCISQWGYDFRPSYLRIAELREKLPGVPVLALTASATKPVAEDIMRHLKFAEPHILRSSFARPNLSYSVRRTDDKNGQLLRLVHNVPGSGIVYMRTREGTEQTAEFLRQEGIPAAAYHGGLGHAERALRQEEWLSGKVRVMVATNAFGMGIDKPDVRFVVHYAMCDSLESYYQEAGRAGRDGQRAYALLLVASDDSDRIARRFEQEFPPLEKVKDIYESVCSYLQVGVGDGGEASFLFNIHDFCAREHLYSGTVLSDAQDNPARVMFCVSRDELYKLRVQRDELDHFIRTLLRLYNGVFTEFRPIDEGELATWSGYTVERVKELLKRLWQLRVIRYIPSNRSPILFLNEERLPRADLYIAPETYRLRQQLMRERFEQMVAYADNDDECRSAVLERYFGEGDPAPCGVCDVCLARKRAAKAAGRKAAGDADPDSAALREKLLQRRADSPADPRQLADGMACTPERLAGELRTLLDKGEIRTMPDGRLALSGDPDSLGRAN